MIEPLLGLFAHAAGHVLLPAAAFGSTSGAILLIGRSRSGKSSLAARAAADGVGVLGDDHVLVAGSGECRAFPRRIRVYSDLAETAPRAYKLLPRSKRAELRALGALRSIYFRDPDGNLVEVAEYAAAGFSGRDNATV